MNKPSFAALALLPALALAQSPNPANSPVVPALAGANVAQLNAPAMPSPEQLMRDMDAKRAQAERSRDQALKSLQQVNAGATPQLGAPGGAPAAASPLPSQSPAMPAAIAAPVPAVSRTTFAAKAAPRKPAKSPTQGDIVALEQRLAVMRSEARVGTAVESGTVRGERAAYVRAKVVFPFYEKSLFEINTSTDRMTTIELEPGEKITTSDGKPRAADTVNWVVDTAESGEGNAKSVLVLVKPITPGAETNLLIPTNKRSYYIVLRSDSQAYMPIVGFNYPFEEAKAREASAKATEVEEQKHEAVGVSPDQIRFGYAVKGSSVEWKPVRVFDDGSKTYIQMPAAMRSSEAPALFVMEDGKDPQLVNYRVKGDYYIVDRLFTRAQLRVGTRNAVDITRDTRAASDETPTNWFGRG